MTPRFEAIPADQAKQRLAQILRDTVPVIHVGYLKTVKGRLPLAHLDATRRPELSDLTRIHRTEGQGDHVATWDVIADGQDVTALLRLDLKRPVRCVFSMTFDVRQHRAWLTDVATSGMIATVFTNEPTDRVDVNAVVGWTIGQNDETLLAALLVDALRAALVPPPVGKAARR